MTPLAYHTKRSFGLTPADAPPVVQSASPQYPTTPTERLLLMATIVLLPLQNRVPHVGEASFLFIIFGVLAVYVFANRLRALARVWLHPVFLAVYAFLAVSSLIEFAHPLSDYSAIFRVGLMVGGAICVAALCRDRGALRAGFYGYMVMSIWMALLLFSTTYGTLSKASAGNFYEASKLRVEVFRDNPSLLDANPNTMSFLLAQGAAVSLALALTARSSGRRILFLGATALCAAAAFLPLSRSGIIILGVSCAAVLYTYGINVKILGMAAVLAAVVLMSAPEAAFSRFTFTTQAREQGKVEGRARIYMADIENLPEYILTGVGAGTFNGGWGLRHGWSNHMHTVTGAHNCFLQVMIYWGLPALVTYLVVVYQASRCLPKRCGVDALSLCLLGIAVSVFFLAVVSHRFYGKEFSLGLGLLVGAHRWIWPEGIVPVGLRKQRLFSSLAGPARRAATFSGH